jgi:hypothetical protein
MRMIGVEKVGITMFQKRRGQLWYKLYLIYDMENNLGLAGLIMIF